MLISKKMFCCVALANSLVAETVSISRAQCFTSFVANLVSKKTKNKDSKNSSAVRSSLLSSVAKKFFSKKHKDDHLAVIPKFSFLGLTVKSILEKKNQWFNGPCWAFSAVAALETYLAHQKELRASLSEKHLLNWANRKEGQNGWHIK